MHPPNPTKSHSTHEDEISQQDMRVLLDHAPDAIARFDSRLRHVYVNETTARENQRPRREFAGKTMEDLGHEPRVCAFINSNLREVFANGKERTSELLFEGPLGPKWFQCRLAPEFDESGNVESVLVISRDITEQRLAAQKIREADSRAASALLARELAHEINNPLTAVVYALHLLNLNPSLNDEARRMLKVAEENAERVAVISKQLLGVYGYPMTKAEEE